MVVIGEFMNQFLEFGQPVLTELARGRIVLFTQISGSGHRDAMLGAITHQLGG